MTAGPHRRSPARTHVVARGAIVCALTVLTLVPATAAAQKDPFIGSFISFHSLLSGTYGDEGPLVIAALDQMEASLAVWEAEGRQSETELRLRGPVDSAELALLYLDGGRHAEALAAIEAGIAGEPRRAGLRRFRGVLLAAAGRVADAVRSFSSASELDPADPLSAYLLAAAVSDQRLPRNLEPQIATLVSAYQQIRDEAPRRAPFIQSALLDDRAADTPQFSPAAYAEGFALFTRGRYRDAIARFRTAVRADPLMRDPAARSRGMAEASAALRQGLIPAAIERLEAVVAASPLSSEAHRMLGSAHRANGKTVEAVAHLRTAIRLAPADQRARLTLARALREAGQMHDAERALRETIAELPTLADAHWALADVYQKSARGPETIEALEAASTFTVVAGKGQLYWRLASVAHEIFDLERVATALGRRVRLMPNDPQAHRAAGLAYYRVGRHDRALAELIVSSMLGLEDGETLAAMGQIHFDAGRYPDAEQVLRRAIVQAPESMQARYLLGRTLVRLGSVEKAKEQFAEFQRLSAAATDERRRTIELERKREEDPPSGETGQ